MAKVLVIAVHPDDESIGCSGTILKHKSRNDGVYWMIVTNISTGDGFSAEVVEKRQSEIARVSEAYGFDGVYKLDLPTRKLDTIPMFELISKFTEVIEEVKPEIVILPFRWDRHTDHQVAFNAAYSCTRNFRFPFIKKVMMMEAISETEFAPALQDCAFVPNFFVDITEFFKKKIDIVNMYTDEMGKHPFPRSAENLKALATLRGATAGCRYAESFMILKEID